MPTEVDVSAIEQLLAGALSGPVAVVSDDGGCEVVGRDPHGGPSLSTLAREMLPAEAELYVALRNKAPDILALVPVARQVARGAWGHRAGRDGACTECGERTPCPTVRLADRFDVLDGLGEWGDPGFRMSVSSGGVAWG